MYHKKLQYLGNDLMFIYQNFQIYSQWKVCFFFRPPTVYATAMRRMLIQFLKIALLSIITYDNMNYNPHD